MTILPRSRNDYLHAAADPEIQRGGGANHKDGDASLLFWPIFPKTAWKWNIRNRRGACPWYPLGSANGKAPVYVTFDKKSILREFIIQQPTLSQRAGNLAKMALTVRISERNYFTTFYIHCIRVFHKHTKFAMLALLPTLYSHIFLVFFFVCTN